VDAAGGCSSAGAWGVGGGGARGSQSGGGGGGGGGGSRRTETTHRQPPQDDAQQRQRLHAVRRGDDGPPRLVAGGSASDLRSIFFDSSDGIRTYVHLAVDCRGCKNSKRKNTAASMGQCAGRHSAAADDVAEGDTKPRAQSWAQRKSSPDMSKYAQQACEELASTPQPQRSRALSFAGSSAAFNDGQPSSAGGLSSDGSRPSSAAKSVSSVTFSEHSPSVLEISPGIRLSPEQVQHNSGDEGDDDDALYDRADSVRVDGSSNGGQTGERHAVFIADLDGEHIASSRRLR
jgi:hypothetical protein